MSGTRGTGHRTRDGGDLGRRAAYRRAELGLTVEQVARRSGMAPGYVIYLEEHPPNLSPWALARLARALETTPESLLGADTDLPAGHSTTFGPTPSLDVLDSEECMDLIRPGGVGRVAFLAETEEAPMVLPVNFAVVDGEIFFRTSQHGVIATHATGPMSFQVDRLDGALSQGWSVLVKGRARLVGDPAELDDLAAVPVRPWAGGNRETCVVITPTSVSGRRVRSGVLP